MVHTDALCDALVPNPFGASVPDGSRDLPMVLLCAAGILPFALDTMFPRETRFVCREALRDALILVPVTVTSLRH